VHAARQCEFREGADRHDPGRGLGHGLGEFVDPDDDGGFTVMQIAGKFHVIDPDGEQTGKYFLSPEKAMAKAQQMSSKLA
jgi:hypothetical protein